MKCYICMKLHAENRIGTPSDADVIVGGVSTCMHHSSDLAAGRSSLVAVELAREQLRRWWEEALLIHGPWRQRWQSFTDKTKLAERFWEGRP